MSEEIAIKAEQLSKIYKLYSSPVDRLKESLHPLRKQYHHDFYALNDVNFEIKKGESVGIIGKNGSGKSTLLKILTGVLTPTSGNVQVSGKISALLELGAGFNPELSGIENIYFNGMLIGYTREEMDVRLDDILSFADLGEFVHQPVKTYSSGMFVRLAFAVAVNVEPDILIIDEALAVGDLRFQKKCKERMNAIKGKGATIILVSHSMSDIRTMCTKGLFLQHGSLIQCGDAFDVINKYSEYLSMEEADEWKSKIDQVSNIPSKYGGDIAGTEDIILKNVRCFQKGNDADNSEIEFGQVMVIEFEYETLTKIIKPVITINIGSPNYRIIANISSINHHFRICELSGIGKVRAEITNQQFYPGAYVIHIAATSEDVNVHMYMHNNAGGFVVKTPKDRLLCYPAALVQPEAVFSIEGY